MMEMFEYAESFNQDISNWDVSNVYNMSCMFFAAKSFNQDVSLWDVSNVEYLGTMFNSCNIREEYKPKVE